MISLIIPCIPKHFHFLDRVLNAYLNGSILPDEVIINYSESSKVTKPEIDFLKSKYSKNFSKFIFCAFPQKLYAGKNRNYGTRASTGDIIVYQDADDLPHKQRLEIIKYFFTYYDIMHLAHSYVFSENLLNTNIDLTKIKIITSDVLYTKYFPNKRLIDCTNKINAFGEGFQNLPVHGGAIAVKRNVFKKIRWKDACELKLTKNPKAEDYEFCFEALFNFNKSMIIDAPIYFYNLDCERAL